MSSPSIDGTSSIVMPVTGAATREENSAASNSAMARVALHPPRTWSQNRCRPMPKGDTTPMPVMTTRGRPEWRISVICYLTAMAALERLFVWGGGAAFVASLAVCVAAYGITWSDAGALRQHDTRAIARSIAVNAALFVLFAAHHSVFARDSVKAWMTRHVPDRLLRSVYVWVASGLLILLIASWQAIGGLVYEHAGWMAVPHIAVQLAGLWLVTQSVRAIDALELAGIRRAGASDGLQIAGPYHLVRHPLYLGWILIVFGASRMTGDRLLFATITSTYLLLAVPWEERSLEGAFGDAYRRYKREVRWRVLPYVY